MSNCGTISNGPCHERTVRPLGFARDRLRSEPALSLPKGQAEATDCGVGDTVCGFVHGRPTGRFADEKKKKDKTCQEQQKNG